MTHPYCTRCGYPHKTGECTRPSGLDEFHPDTTHNPKVPETMSEGNTE